MMKRCIVFTILVLFLTALAFFLNPSEEIKPLVVQRKQAENPTNSLTSINEQGDLSPRLAKSWSNLRPKLWEFQIAEGLKSDQLALELEKEMEKKNEAVSSIESLVSINDDRLHIITKVPDPLLPQKLSTVDFRNLAISQALLKNEEGQIIQEVVESDPKKLKNLISESKVDLFDEPEPGLWPYLSKNGYKILPKINTESVLILAKRNEGPLQEKKVVKVLQSILQSPSLLSASYFEYGRLASQFVPPGITGYDPDLRISSPEGITDLPKNVSLGFQKAEERLGLLIKQELEKNGITVSLDDPDPDLFLLRYDFELGDMGPFLETFVDSEGGGNRGYKNDEVNKLLSLARRELNQVKRKELLQKINNVIVNKDPIGIPLLFVKSFVAKK